MRASAPAPRRSSAARSLRSTGCDGVQWKARSCSFCAMRADLGRDIVEAEARGRRIGEHAGDERAQPPAMVIRRVRLLPGGDDERADAAAGFDDACPLELGVYACD